MFEVTQEDREVAASLWRALGEDGRADSILAGHHDQAKSVQGVAAHRTGAMKKAEERIATLEAALKPFAECVEQISPDEDDEEWAKFRLLIGDYRRAAKAFASSTTPEQR